jgi:hypothetical protein
MAIKLMPRLPGLDQQSELKSARVRPPVVDRSALIDRLERSTARRLTIVSAPAGSGKSRVSRPPSTSRSTERPPTSTSSRSATSTRSPRSLRRVSDPPAPTTKFGAGGRCVTDGVSATLSFARRVDPARAVGEDVEDAARDGRRWLGRNFVVVQIARAGTLRDVELAVAVGERWPLRWVGGGPVRLSI